VEPERADSAPTPVSMISSPIIMYRYNMDRLKNSDKTMLTVSSVTDPVCFIPDPDPNILHPGNCIKRGMKNKNLKGGRIKNS
jgi:hypothetical protein